MNSVTSLCYFNPILCGIFNPGRATNGGVFRNSLGMFIGAFVESYGVSSSHHSELLAAMRAIELAHDKGWHFLWLECDSTLVTLACKSLNLVLWNLRNKMNFRISHIFREDST